MNEKELPIYNQIIKQTQDFKALYLVKVAEHAIKEFARYKSLANYTNQEWLEKHGVTVNYNFKLTGVRESYRTISKAGDALRSKSWRLSKMGEAAFVEKEVKNGEEHYKASIEKLTYRIVQKGLFTDKVLSITTNFLNQNLDCFVSDGTKTVHAFTILAWGDIQKPHYRFLIK